MARANRPMSAKSSSVPSPITRMSTQWPASPTLESRRRWPAEVERLSKGSFRRTRENQQEGTAAEGADKGDLVGAGGLGTATDLAAADFTKGLLEGGGLRCGYRLALQGAPGLVLGVKDFCAKLQLGKQRETARLRRARGGHGQESALAEGRLLRSRMALASPIRTLSSSSRSASLRRARLRPGLSADLR